MTARDRYTPGLLAAIKIARKPLLAYLLFCLIGFLVFATTVLTESHSSEKTAFELLVACVAGIVGVLSGQLLALLRLRVIPLVIAATITLVVGITAMTTTSFHLPETLAISVVFFTFAFPCGLLSLQHRFELLSIFWPSVGWIGAVFTLLNAEHRVVQWQENKLSAWQPLPLAILFGFLVLLLAVLAMKQTVRVELWLALSGTATRRLEKQRELAVLPRKNLFPMLVVVLVLFVFTAVLSPFLFRTGKGERGSKETQTTEPEPDRTPKIDEDAVMRMLEKMKEGARKASYTLWPLLLLAILYRPAKRALLVSHLKAPIIPSPPSERIENLWEYVRIAAEDAGVEPSPSDSVEDLLRRVKDARFVSADLAACAEIYARSRYGFVLRPGDAMAMKKPSLAAARELRRDMTFLQRVRAWWRPLR